MAAGTEAIQPDHAKQCLVNHLAMVIFLKRYPNLARLLSDLRYDIEFVDLKECGGLTVAVLNTPLKTFLPPDEYIIQVTQLSGVSAFQELIDLDAIDAITDPLKELFKQSIG